LILSRADALFERYGAHHQNPTNKAVHWICVPLIVWSVLGLLWSAAPLAAYAALAAALAFYLWLSVPLALGMAAVLAVMLARQPFFARNSTPPPPSRGYADPAEGAHPGHTRADQDTGHQADPADVLHVTDVPPRGCSDTSRHR
jgi:hypothetical protein